jgi:hypothetical protein
MALADLRYGLLAHRSNCAMRGTAADATADAGQVCLLGLGVT